MNNDLFSTRAAPSLKTCCYFALTSYVTILGNYISYQVEMVRAQSTNHFIGSITTVARHVGMSLLLQLFCHVASS